MTDSHLSYRSRRRPVEVLEPRRLLSATIGPASVVNVSHAPGPQSETAIAVDPLNPQHLFTASNASGSSLFGAVSTDGGQTWAGRDFATGSDGLPQACCDPSVAFDHFGNLFVSYLDTQSGEAEVLFSADGGQSFRLLASLGGHADQPTVTTGGGSVWVGFEQDLQGPPMRNSKARPLNAGAVLYGARVDGLNAVGPFQKPQAITGLPGTNVGDIAVGPAGQVTVAYMSSGSSGPSTLFVRVDPDGLGPRKLGPPVAVGQTNVTDFYTIPAQSRRTIDAEAGLAYYLSGGPAAGRLYFLYTDAAAAGSDDTDIFVRFSDDDGTTWSGPVRVNDVATGSQFFPRIAVDPTSGAVGVTWYDARNDTGTPGAGGTDSVVNDDVQVYGAIGTPTATGILFSPNFQVTAGFSRASLTNDPNDFGDYTGLAFYGGVLHPAWADNSNSTGDNPDGQAQMDLYAASATVQVTPAPTRALAGEFGDIGKKLTVTDSDGTAVTLSLSHGRGYAFVDGSNIDLKLQGTSARSALTLTTRGGDSKVTLGNCIVSGPLGSFTARTADLLGTLSVQGTVGKATLDAISGGTFAAAGGIGTFTLTSLTGGMILSGANFGPDGLFGGGDDAFAPGSIGALRVNDAIQSSLIAAGLDPVDGIFNNGNDQILGGKPSIIRGIFARAADPATQFAAGAFRTVRLPTRIDPATDPRFRIG